MLLGAGEDSLFVMTMPFVYYLIPVPPWWPACFHAGTSCRHNIAFLIIPPVGAVLRMGRAADALDGSFRDMPSLTVCRRGQIAAIKLCWQQNVQNMKIEKK